MKIDYKSYPLLRAFDAKADADKLYRISVKDYNKVRELPLEDKKRIAALMADLTVSFASGLIRRRCKDNIKVYTKSFLDAAMRSGDAFKDIGVMDFFRENLRDGVVALEEMTAFIIVDDGVIKVATFMGELFVSRFSIRMSDGYIPKGYYTSWILGDNGVEDGIGYINTIMNVIFYLLAFEKYAKVESRVTLGGRRFSFPSGEAVYSRLPFKVRTLDSSWYTTIIRDEEFGVRGHFRLQPCGEGRKERRLIYIAPFVKHGYHRVAGIVKSQTNKNRVS